MVAIAYTDITTPAPVAKVGKPAPKKVQNRPAGDPLVDATTRLLSCPLHQLYAVLYRTGLLMVDS